MSVSYGQWVKDIGVEASYSAEGLGMIMLKLPLTIESRAKPWGSLWGCSPWKL